MILARDGFTLHERDARASRSRGTSVTLAPAEYGKLKQAETFVDRFLTVFDLF